jgi:hypothetical protein
MEGRLTILQRFRIVPPRQRSPSAAVASRTGVNMILAVPDKPSSLAASVASNQRADSVAGVRRTSANATHRQRSGRRVPIGAVAADGFDASAKKSRINQPAIKQQCS